ncbi:hypothetical protein GCM10011491_14830 [Brucella endophytica]|uniref:FAD-binding PCMH-type domain-containing protein n=1 Tax=Brucella endophytica TaxID=1963359 RepID=A0A916WCW1_9HYPH|nr:hypothetical protein GCM10011491_14830 [Brucella endophytica]
MKLGAAQPGHLIDVTTINGMDAIETEGDTLRFGALAPMSAVAANETVNQDYPLLSEALWRAASQQLRNMATVGGNLLQRTRCMYFRNGAGSSSTVGVYPCNKRARARAARLSASSTAARRRWGRANPARRFPPATGRLP